MIRTGQTVQHVDATAPGLVLSVERGVAVVRFSGPDGWPFPTTVRVPVDRLKPFTPEPPPFEPAPF